MPKRDRWSVLAVGLLLAGLALGLLLRTLAPPAPVRLLPKASGIVYLDLKPLRAAKLLDRATIGPDPAYQQFVDATGFKFERDLDEAAFALNEVPAQADPRQQRIAFSEVFVGRFNPVRLEGYLNRLAAQKERYRERNIYDIAIEGRTVRASILDANSVAVSNAIGAQDLHTIMDRRTQSVLAILPFGQEPLLREYYHSIPLASLVWAILRMKSAPADVGLDPRIPGGYALLFPPHTVLVASSRYMGAVQLRAEAFTRSKADAEQIVSNIDTLLNLFRSVEANVRPGGGDPDVKAAFESARVEQTDARAVFQATLPPGFLKKLSSESEIQPGSVNPDNR